MRSFLTIAWLLVVLSLGPVAGVLGARRVAAQMPPRRLLYLTNAANLVVLGAITAAIDAWRGAPALALFAAPLSGVEIALWAAVTSLGALAIWLGALFARARLQWPPKRTVVRILPKSTAEKVAFALLCLLIGTVEEYLYRGFSLMLLREWFSSDLAAVLLVGLSFALMHGIQDRIAIAGAFCQGLLLSVPVLVTGSLVPSVIAHAVVDVASGFALLTVLQRMGMPATMLESNSG